jgi:gamma-glutamylcyclotransferase (GGCT)/AIG2-like uncharacterized protein YtfP
MSSRLSEQWNNEAFRRSATIALRLWNGAGGSRPGSGPERQHAVRALQQLWTPTHAVSLRETQADAGFSKAAPVTEAAQIVELVDRLLNFPSRRLAVYGSLAPGKQNHHQMAGMQGTWRKAVLRGSLRNEGWGAGQGFPGFVWDGTQTAIDAQVFTSDDLPQHWRRLDEFEGAEYRRILVPVEIIGNGTEVCNVYELAKKSP